MSDHKLRTPAEAEALVAKLRQYDEKSGDEKSGDEAWVYETEPDPVTGKVWINIFEFDKNKTKKFIGRA